MRRSARRTFPREKRRNRLGKGLRREARDIVCDWELAVLLRALIAQPAAIGGEGWQAVTTPADDKTAAQSRESGLSPAGRRRSQGCPVLISRGL
jgi:hypothetical protein